MNKNTIVTELKNYSDKYGFITVLNEFSPNIHVRIPMTQSLWDTSVEELSLSVRSRNGIMRAGARTIGDISKLIMSETGLNGVRNLGKKSVSEIKTAVLELAYGKLTDYEKLEFWLYVADNNGGRDHAIS